MSCVKFWAFLKFLVILAATCYVLTMLVITTINYINYNDQEQKINQHMMTCLDICGPDYSYPREFHQCCNSMTTKYSCIFLMDCQRKMLSDLDSQMWAAEKQWLIYLFSLVPAVLYFCKHGCQPCSNLCQRNHEQKPNENVEGLRESFLVAKGHDDNCAICLQGLQENKVIRLNCIHLFHGACIREWIAKNNSCPVCRMPN